MNYFFHPIQIWVIETQKQSSKLFDPLAECCFPNKHNNQDINFFLFHWGIARCPAGPPLCVSIVLNLSNCTQWRVTDTNTHTDLCGGPYIVLTKLEKNVWQFCHHLTKKKLNKNYCEYKGKRSKLLGEKAYVYWISLGWFSLKVAMSVCGGLYVVGPPPPEFFNRVE